MNRCIQALNWATAEMPTGKAQAALAAVYNSMPQSSEAKEDAVVLAMASAVIDGLRYGNWVGHTDEERVALAQKRDARRAAKGE